MLCGNDFDFNLTDESSRFTDDPCSSSSELDEDLGSEMDDCSTTSVMFQWETDLRRDDSIPLYASGLVDADFDISVYHFPRLKRSYQPIVESWYVETGGSLQNDSYCMENFTLEEIPMECCTVLGSNFTNGIFTVDGKSPAERIDCDKPPFVYEYACSRTSSRILFPLRYGCKSARLHYFIVFPLGILLILGVFYFRRERQRRRAEMNYVDDVLFVNHENVGPVLVADAPVVGGVVAIPIVMPTAPTAPREEGRQEDLSDYGEEEGPDENGDPMSTDAVRGREREGLDDEEVEGSYDEEAFA